MTGISYRHGKFYKIFNFTKYFPSLSQGNTKVTVMSSPSQCFPNADETHRECEYTISTKRIAVNLQQAL